MVTCVSLVVAAALGVRVCDALASAQGIVTNQKGGPRPLILTESLDTHANSMGEVQSAYRGQHEVPAGWFGDFDQMESTFDPDGINAYINENGQKKVDHGIEIGYRSPFSQPDTKADRWFQETASAGSDDAWQTFYPQQSGGFVGTKGAKLGRWRSTPEGWVQDYVPAPSESGVGELPAWWFDNSVRNYDGFGRRSMPDTNNPRHLLVAEQVGPPDYDAGGGPWAPRSTNATLACPGIACIASARLGVYDADTEESANCRLSIKLHPTDFDGINEETHTWLVNNVSVNSVCDPMARGCNASAWRPLFNCLTDYAVDHLLDDQGIIEVQGQLSEMVDECPYEGNLLSGVALLTCMVRPKVTPPPLPTVELKEVPVPLSTSGSALLRCREPGCTAETFLRVDPSPAALGGTCLLNITAYPTDFDNTVPEAPEVIEFIWLEGAENISTDIKPGLNPCLEQFEGKNVTEEQLNYSVVLNLNVTAEVLAAPSGFLHLRGKISKHVDECDHEGYLLWADAQVQCTRPAQAESSDTDAKSDGASLAEVEPSGRILLSQVGRDTV